MAVGGGDCKGIDVSSVEKRMVAVASKLVEFLGYYDVEGRCKVTAWVACYKQAT